MSGYIKKSRSNNWGTPKHIKQRFVNYFDPCPHPRAIFDGLSIDWKERNFCNPPYNNIAPWALKCVSEMEKGNTSVLLVPARTCTRWFHNHVLPYARIEFIRGRLRFIDLDNSSNKPTSAPFPSILCFFEP